MAAFVRIEGALEAAMAGLGAGGSPPQLLAAVRHAVFPGGARIRPQLCLAVAQACGDDQPGLSDAAAVAIELLHCASLVHDDLPCFDDAPVRRGQPSVHSAFGERLAVLAGDALIVSAFQVLSQAGAARSDRLVPLLLTLTGSVGLPRGIVAGQAWECEPRVSLQQYHQQKTGALFAAATVAGAQSAGGDASAWRGLGEWLGEAYQAADDIRDVIADAAQLGKPIGRDATLGRPSLARERGLPAAVRHFDSLIRRAADAVPECLGAPALRGLVRSEAERLVPMHMAAPLRAVA